MQMVFTVSVPFYEPDGDIVGVTAIAVPVDVFLQEDEHIRNLSNNIRSLLVRPEIQDATAKHGVRILAREQLQNEMNHHWRALLEDEWLELDNSQQLESIIRDLQQENTDVRKISYMGQESLLAYGSIDDYQTALLIIVPEADVVAEANAMESYVLTRIKRQITVTSIMLSVVILLVIGLAFILSRSITENMSKLVSAVRRVASGDFAARVHIKSRDEIGELGRTFNNMVPELEERVAMKQALDFAMEVQQNLLPKEVPQINGLDVAGRSIYCDETGGDFYDFLEICCQPSDRIAIAVGDVSGHGISAALLMASVRAFFRSRVRQPGSVADIVSDVNHLVAEDTGETGHFMTLFYAEIAPDQKTLRWVRAGHDPALYYDPATDRFEELRGNGMALGIDSQFKYEENAISGLSEGQILVLGTDGLWETQNETGEMFGKERLKALIKQNAHSSAEEMIASMIKGLLAFRKSIRQADDITLVVIKITA
jgi:sigma-B regulation protein RsbU (phosphoserine phosphatase)